MAGQGLIGAGGVIFADAGGGWWIDFPVESEVIMDGGHHREVKEIQMAHLALRYAHSRVQRSERVLGLASSIEGFGPMIAVIVLRVGTHPFVLIDGTLRE
jgi:hypothetical protein